MIRVSLKPKRDWSVRRHHPWIFSGALDLSEAVAAQAGETVEVVSAEGETLGYGSYSPASQIRVRMLSFEDGRIPDAAFVAELVSKAVARRRAFFESGSKTSACRLVNAENDGLPGVVADCYDGWVVCQLTSAFAERWKGTIAEALAKELCECRGVSARLDADVRRKEGLAVGEAGALEILAGDEPPALVEIVEGEARYFVDVRKGHKTGFYLDQREARSAVAALSAGAEVLNCFAYTGGFGIAAAVGGARHVTQVDISGDALALARKNAELIPHPSSPIPQFSYFEQDVFKYLRGCRDARRTFDLIVLDPPKFADSKAQVMKAARGYKDINLLAMKLLRPNGVLATFSCSGAMTTELFDKILAEAAGDAGREFQVLARTRQAADHPVRLSFPEGLYLKGVILKAMA